MYCSVQVPGRSSSPSDCRYRNMKDAHGSVPAEEAEAAPASKQPLEASKETEPDEAAKEPPPQEAVEKKKEASKAAPHRKSRAGHRVSQRRADRRECSICHRKIVDCTLPEQAVLQGWLRQLAMVSLVGTTK